ncbi:hypothetical protein BKA82DRAFT_665352 [Pisolithus tinctorius]|uniref:C2H2-type domain-containing protein n=1 Tax=Pisolithus tinctorius Marx 270 TaxID=870435 RepID=A0A0C3JYC6_PISTI|nr:hypothetical protein BKA82DRAFT_665352 [Pisolithus tinctorius]KIO02372.1 hypothetical protein M404DRAFT_665352 [Pisolithus tinctorius Marx 270]
MSDPRDDNLFSSFELYGPEYAKQQQQQQGLDFVSFHSPSDILAPHPDLFELELDSSLAAFNEGVHLQLLTVDSNDAYSFLRSDTPTCGPPSTITASSESAYETLSSRSESFYNFSDSSYPTTNCPFPLDIEMDFQRIRVTNSGCSEYGTSAAVQANPNNMPVTVDPSAFGALPISPRSSPTAPVDHSVKRASYSDYGGASRIAAVPRSSTADFYLSCMGTDPAVSQSGMSQLAVTPCLSQSRAVRSSEEHSRDDPRKKYQCPTCPRAFARAYNLKTHMATHDPNRLKPHVCPHRNCGRSFSRKHDLGRHLVSIHREESVRSLPSAAPKPIGVDSGPRGWCDNCGKGWVGTATECSCADIK